ncbi:SpoIIE family protein phosphatase [Mycolicibacterium diernhoferi]|uniref:Histidine kinase n=2 Tax=Mycolicibacterium diernhoferi TaxID=1801 RepID=A0A1Q4HL10_9MYCO|nr:SpoIIE family protein phosphatase [Mycolicibacterium diernhoferi]OJZ68224.1 histidine kinase [Mycolicibacterium diernhoferi]PEG56216.1 histidine kinase [Mycolicibacterium diernhoferi]QYL25691.1 SpoIIE family protein phosphatase [Mycolicibacterium diernhoferi]
MAISRQDADGTVDGLLPVGTPIDLDNCAREPIHIPGSIQPRGVLVVVQEPEFEIRQVSANVAELLGHSVEEVLGRHLSVLIGPAEADRITQAASAFGDLRQRNPLELELSIGGQIRAFDALLHREPGGVLLVELEIAYGERPFSFPNTYQAVRNSVEELNRAATTTELYDTTARAVRDLLGFDRVMVYRYDQDYNGEVVAECKRDDLNSFLGLHFPASDIPAQARAMYEQNWLRLISDVGYTPAPLVPSTDPATGSPLDLTHASLRSVSPIHIEYLQNMGVRASMSISLLRHGRLWGLIACHHYAGPHLPPYGARAAAEFLGSTLSLRLVDRFDDDQLRERLAAQSMLAHITAATINDSEPVAAALLGTPSVLDLLPAAGVAVDIGGEYRTQGTVPPAEVVAAVATWARATGEETGTTECLSRELPTLELDPQDTAGALALNLPDDQYVIWFRQEALRSVDWGGDPHNKAIAVQEGDEIRLSPRKSFERWREVVDQCCEPWGPIQIESAEMLRGHLVEELYRRTRSALRVADIVQRSLLPESIPTISNWDLSTDYRPAVGGRVGGDWYDAFVLPDGRLTVVLGDVAGHGLAAAGAMAQLRNALRSLLFTGATPADALSQLNAFSRHLMARAFATAVAVRIDLDSGRTEAASAGHLMPYLTGGRTPVTAAPIRLSPPIGVKGGSYAHSEFVLERGQGLVMFSDGLVERRDGTIDDGLERLARVLDRAGDSAAQQISSAMRPEDTDDDVTVITLRRR